jgi:hypothetical protein
MVWDRGKLAIEVVEVFASAQAPYTNAQAAVTLAYGAELLARHRERTRDYARQKRGGLKGHAYNDGRWRGRRPATRYVQLDLPFMEQAIMRERLPADRPGVNQKFTIYSKRPDDEGGGIEEIDIYLTANVYPDEYDNAARRGQLGEVFLRIGKAGGTEAIYDEWAKTTSRSLQYGVPVDDLFWQHVGTRFTPFGATSNKNFPRCTSILDLVSRWILSRFGSAESKNRIASMQKREEVEAQP